MHPTNTPSTYIQLKINEVKKEKRWNNWKWTFFVAKRWGTSYTILAQPCHLRPSLHTSTTIPTCPYYIHNKEKTKKNKIWNSTWNTWNVWHCIIHKHELLNTVLHGHHHHSIHTLRLCFSAHPFTILSLPPYTHNLPPKPHTYSTNSPSNLSYKSNLTHSFNTHKNLWENLC